MEGDMSGKTCFMKYLITSLFAFLIAFSTVFAQADAVATTQTETQAPTSDENSLLWEISGKELSTPSWLYGTIHLIGKDDFFLTDSTRLFIGRSEMVVFEINMEDMTDITAQLGLLMKAFMDNGKTLKDLLNEEDYKLVQDHFAEIGMPLFMFERIKPMFLTVMASGDMSPTAMSSGEMVSYEMEIMEISQAVGKKMGGLESMEFQMSVFDSIPYEAQAQMLVESIKSSDEGNEEFAKMVELYKTQDIQGMVEMMGDSEGIAEYEDLLLNTRNKNWIPVMGEMMTTQPTFFAVGAGHLGGENGVVALLRKEGYRVKPVR